MSDSSLASVAGYPDFPTTHPNTGEPKCFLRRKAAGIYLTQKYGFGAARTLAKAAVTGDGPEYHKAGRTVLYTHEALDRWAIAKISTARRSTSDLQEFPAPQHIKMMSPGPRHHKYDSSNTTAIDHVRDNFNCQKSRSGATTVIASNPPENRGQ